ncbi:methyl-accepting chemotaxis protein [Agarivorans sp. Z349TD_8]|uniref:methyl-accepting chemotaxis protein n=1 Tax=Agarivorans sp. Z349TD_8 TaxID=3421434 RepID=UPI003D7CAAB4
MSDERVRYSKQDSLISTTTSDSHITYCNQDFCQVSGYQAAELKGKPHNVIRHQDMPKAAFTQLWQYIQSGQSWMGLVKNRCKGSGHYWVSAFVTPIVDKSGKVYEYQSVRTEPDDAQIRRAETVYQALNKGEDKRFRRRWLGVSSALACVTFVAVLLGAAGYLWWWLPVIVAGLQLPVMWWNHRRHRSVVDLAQRQYSNALMEYPYTGHFDDWSAIELAVKMKGAELRAVTARSIDTTSQIREANRDELASRKRLTENLNEQTVATEAMAASAEEMLSAIEEVANDAQENSVYAQKVQQIALDGQAVVNNTLDSAQQLHQELLVSHSSLEQLNQDVNSVEGILGLIQAIAEQTNLLALNAAIEAARAGESGRGFAVVADEVRTLSEKTTHSVDDIRNKIEGLKATATDTGKKILAGQHYSNQSVEQTQQTHSAFSDIVSHINSIGERSARTSEALSEQATVTHEMVNHIHRMKEAISGTGSLSELSEDRTRQVILELDSLERLIRAFDAKSSF